MARQASNHRQDRAPRPLNAALLRELALFYVARYAVSAAKLEAYLKRKLRERGWEDEGDPDIGELVGRYIGLGYVDDEVYARTKSASLLRRGYGPRRVDQALGAAGIAQDIRARTRAGEGTERSAALAMARKRGFGPFGPELPDRALRQRQVAAMLRAGHSLDSARELVNAHSTQDAEEWAKAAMDDEVFE